MEEVMRAVAGTTKTPEVIAEAERFRNVHRERAEKTVDILPDVSKKSTINLNMQFFAEKDLENQSSTSLRKGIRSLNKEVEIHKEKLKNPKNYDENWENKTEKQKEGLLKHWRKEINNHEESINNRIEELRKRGEYFD